MKSEKTCTCIIPCYNEESRIGSVLRVVTRSKKINQFICVDDGSEDSTAAAVETDFPQVLIVRLENNQGKAAAVFRGLLEATGDYIFLLDADLKNLDLQEMDLAIKK